MKETTKQKYKNNTIRRQRTRKKIKLKKKSKKYLIYKGLNGKEKSWYLYVMKNK